MHSKCFFVQIKLCDKRLLAIKPPDVSQQMRSLCDYKQWKGEECVDSFIITL